MRNCRGRCSWSWSRQWAMLHACAVYAKSWPSRGLFCKINTIATQQVSQVSKTKAKAKQSRVKRSESLKQLNCISRQMPQAMQGHWWAASCSLRAHTFTTFTVAAISQRSRHINFNLLHILSTRNQQTLRLQLWISWEFPAFVRAATSGWLCTCMCVSVPVPSSTYIWFSSNNGLFMLMLCNQNAYDLNANKKSTRRAKTRTRTAFNSCSLLLLVRCCCLLVILFLRMFNGLILYRSSSQWAVLLLSLSHAVTACEFVA